MVDILAGQHPLKRIAETDEIAPIVAFLARDEAGWVNGQTIHVNGVSTFRPLESFYSDGRFRDLRFKLAFM